MGILDKIIKDHDRSGVRTYNQLRLSLTLIGPAFIIFGILGLMGYGEILSDGRIAEGVDREISYAIFLAIGIISLTLRLAVFKNKRNQDKRNT